MILLLGGRKNVCYDGIGFGVRPGTPRYLSHRRVEMGAAVPSYGRHCRPAGKAMRRLLLAAPLPCAFHTVHAFAQHERSQQLLEMDEGDRNIFFTMVLRASNKECDQVIRTIFNDSFLGFDEWEALCRDHNSYSLKVAADPDATITSLHCRELSKTSKMLLQSVGSESKASGCRIEKERRKRD
jgi:hypothetical protein